MLCCIVYGLFGCICVTVIVVYAIFSHICYVYAQPLGGRRVFFTVLICSGGLLKRKPPSLSGHVGF